MWEGNGNVGLTVLFSEKAGVSAQSLKYISDVSSIILVHEEIGSFTREK